MDFTRSNQGPVKSLLIHLPLFTQQIFIGEELSDLIINLLAEHRAKNVVVVSESIYPRVKDMISQISGSDPIVIKSHEGNKTIDFVRELAPQCQAKGLNRDGYLIGIGSGMVGDLVGFLASVFMRGVKFVFVPTTLLSQCDSSINKVAVNVDSTKNLLGSFYSPHFTFCDTRFLQTLSKDQIVYGLVEMIKHTLISGSSRFNQMLRTSVTEGLIGWEKIDWTELIFESLRIKSSLVEADPFDRHGIQKGLNYGHTIGHSLEGLSGYTLPHGHAVAIGMKLAGHISNQLGMLTKEDLDSQHELLQLAQLELALPQNLDIPGLIAWMKKDKVNDGNGLRLVLLEKLGKYQLKGGISEELITEMIVKHLMQ